MSWQAFRQIDQRVSEQEALDALQREIDTGSALLPGQGEHTLRFYADQLERLAALDVQRQIPGSVVTRQGGQFSITTPTGQQFTGQAALASFLENARTTGVVPSVQDLADQGQASARGGGLTQAAIIGGILIVVFAGAVLVLRRWA